MGYRCFEVTESDRVAHIRLSRPDELNSMVREFWTELPEIVDGISDEGRSRAIGVSSTGKHFCAGMDLSVFTGGDDRPGILDAPSGERGRLNSRTRQAALLLQHTFTCLEQARMPVLAAIQGGCVGGAVDMVTACDMRYATADAFFVVQEINIGMTADVGTLQRLPKLIPDGVARELAYTGRRMSAQRAHEVGLVNEVFDTQAAMLDAVMAVAAEIASKSPLAIWGTKEAVNYARDHSVADSLAQIATWQAGMFQPGDMIEAFTAKSEGRDPDFDDLGPSGAL